MRWVALVGVAGLAACSQPEKSSSAAMPTDGGDCAALAKLALPDTSLTAELVAAGSFKPAPPAPAAAFANLPEICRVSGTIKPTSDSDIRFELWLPAKGWNGKFMGTGNGGAAGAIIHTAMIEPVRRGYAAANTDTGHTGGQGDFAWAAGHREKLVDYAWRAVHLMTVNSKAITKAHYASAPKYSYWNGCSTGGRQGLKEAQEFPGDYDGIIAGAPAANWDALNTHSVQAQRELTSPGALPVSKLSVLMEAAIKACDADDGVTDRIIANPAACKFDPVQAQCAGETAATCLSASEVASARRIYAGVVDPGGKTVYPGTGPGSEPVWAGFASPAFRIGESYYRYVNKQNPNWSAADFKYEDLPAAQKQDAGLLTAMDPDLSGFASRGGKLLLWHGQTDGLITYRNTANYHDSVVGKLGAARTAQHVRLFLAPGVNHCSGGEGPSTVDWIATLERWVEHGEAPDRVIASKGTRTRPLCAYPKIAKYAGSGNTDEAASFVCAAP